MANSRNIGRPVLIPTFSSGGEIPPPPESFFGISRCVYHIAPDPISPSVTDSFRAVSNFPNFRDFQKIRKFLNVVRTGVGGICPYSSEALRLHSLSIMIILSFCPSLDLRRMNSAICKNLPQRAILAISLTLCQISFRKDTHSAYKGRAPFLLHLFRNPQFYHILKPN